MADVFGLPRNYHGLNLWMAPDWRYVGSPTSPHIGAVVVWSYHVGRIVGQQGGEWVVESGNFNGGVATVPMSLRGAIAFRDL